ncbi:MAG: class I tRNA ligase family protein [Planctomycetota bacterium]
MSEPEHRYDSTFAGEIETRWQSVWAERGAFDQPNPGEPGFDASKPKYFVLDMFPYPSGAGLHVGHPEGYTATDILGRYKKMAGFNVLHPMGFDAFGLPAEQYAIQTGVHPAKTTRTAIDNFRRQLQRLGFAFDWRRELATIDEDYYGWTQWIFLKLYNSWFDPQAGEARGRGRPIDELIKEFANGSRPIRVNPEASEHDSDTKSRTFASWEGLSTADRRLVIDSYRLAYIGEQTVNWCPKLGTALANEEVIDGKSERGGFPVFRKPLRQWMFRITAYAGRLLDDLGEVEWPESTRVQQTEWIGRSTGAEVRFELVDAPAGCSGALEVFTTRPDTLFGATYMVVAPEHPLVDALLEAGGSDELRNYVLTARNRSDVERQESKKKTGVLTGVHAINPANGDRVPVWCADYVLAGYGTGAIMAVPAQDDRDWEFAKAFGMPIVRTVQPPADHDEEKAFTGDGPAINSAFLNGLGVADAKSKMIAWLEERGKGERKVNYRLRDWLFSRQRYWGEPFPIVFDADGHHHPIGEHTLPLVLPDLVDYEPVESQDPQPLLAKATDWIATTAGEAGVKDLPVDAPVRREANTMPGWAGSCWYYLRYCDPKNGDRFVGRDAERYWMLTPKDGASAKRANEFGTFEPTLMKAGGVDLYIGGAEHAVLHLLYARFWHKVLFDLGEVSTPEPFAKLFHQGMITSFAYQRKDGSLAAVDTVEEREEGVFIETATGDPVTQVTAKMSKSLKNVINPDDVLAEHGADTFRLYEMYMGPLEASKPWDTRAIGGMHRFIQRLWRVVIDEETGGVRSADTPDGELEKLLHRMIAKVQGDTERLAFNTAIAAMIEFVNAATGKSLSVDQSKRLTLVVSPYVPHVAEELWSRLGGEGLAMLQGWPGFDESMLVDDEVEVPVQVKGKVKVRITVPAGLDAAALETAALAHDEVKALIGDQTLRKVVAVPGRMINLVL